MGNFKEFAVIQRVDKKYFRLVKELVYTTTDGATYKVPRGFFSDLGSIPRPLWAILPRSEFPSAYVLHDFLCGHEWISWADNAMLLKEAVVASNGGIFKAWLISAGVSAWGPLRKIIQRLSPIMERVLGRNE